MLPQAWVPLKHHEKQCQALRHPARFKGLACGRGSGKTEIARRRIVMALAERKPWADPMYFYALPTYGQAKRVAWKPLKALIPPEWIVKCHESEMYIETVFGSALYVLGTDNPARIEGVQWDGCVLDESSDQRPGVFDLSVMPALTHRKGWCWRIGVPKRYGMGAAEFKKFFDRGVDQMDSAFAAWTWPSTDILDEFEISVQRDALDQRDFNEQYMATWEQASGSIFYAFSEANVTPGAVYNPKLPVIVGSDFNVDPMCWVLCHEVNSQLFVFDEIFHRNTNTRATLDRLYSHYQNHEGGWFFYGDASGAARKTSASSSDYIQIRNDERFKNKKVLYPKKNPLIANRFAATNALLCNANDVRRCFIHPKCTRLITDLSQRSYTPGTREPNDSGDVGHMTDALGYIIYAKWPVRIVITETAEVAAYGS